MQTLNQVKNFLSSFLVGRFFFAIILAFIFFFSMVFASPPISPFTPGETLDPSCAPTDVNCTVNPPVYTTSSLTNGAMLYADSSAWSLLSAGTNGQVLTLSGGLPAWGSPVATSWGSITGTLSDQTDLQTTLDAKVPYTGATAGLNLGTYDIITDTAKASTSAGLEIQSNAGTVTALFGAGGGANSTFYGGSKFDYATATTVPYLDASKNLISSAVTPTELGYLSGVTIAIQTQLNAKFTLPSLTAGSVLFSDGSTITQDNANFFWNNTNKRLGIGTTSPIAKLDVRGDALFAGGTRVTKTVTSSDSSAEFENGVSIFKGTNTVGWLLNSDASNNLGLYNWNANGYVFKIESSAPSGSFHIKSNGNIGIGTTSPAYLLDVNTSARVKNTLILGSTGYDSAQLQFARSSNGAIMADIYQASGLTYIRNHQGAGMDFQVYGSADNQTFAFVRNSGLGVNGGTGGGAFTLGAALDVKGASNTSSDWSFTARNASGASLFGVRDDGNVGIGMTGPDRKLDVLDASNPQLRLTHTDGSVYTDFQTTSGGHLIINTSGGFVGIGTGSDEPLEAFSVHNKLLIDGHGDMSTSRDEPLNIITGRGDSELILDTAESSSINIGPNNSYFKDINIGGKGGNNINIAIDDTVADTIVIGSSLDSLDLISENWQISANGTLNVSSIEVTSKAISQLSSGSTNSFAGNLVIGNSDQSDGTVLLTLTDTDSTCDFTANNGSPSCGSDLTLKKDINSLYTVDLLTKVSALNPVSYRWLTDEEGSSLKYGFIAQEVGLQFPELVSDHTWVDGTQRKFLNTGGLMPYVVGAIKELNTKFSTINNLIKSYLADAGNGVESLYAKIIHSDKVETKELCLEDVCVTKEQLQQLLNQSNINTTTVSTNSVNTDSNPVSTDSNSLDTNTDNISVDSNQAVVDEPVTEQPETPVTTEVDQVILDSVPSTE